MTHTRTETVDRLLDEINNLPESEIKKILKLIRFLKEEILETGKEEETNLKLFWESFGSWQDERSAEDIIRDIYESRKSSTRDVQL